MTKYYILIIILKIMNISFSGKLEMGFLAWAVVAGIGSSLIICAPLAAPLVGFTAIGSVAAGSVFSACQAFALMLPTP